MDETSPLYLKLAERLARLAASGSLKPGSRLPSVRSLAAQHGVSVSTAMLAYRTLEDRGLIEVRPKSGFFVRAQRARLPVPAATRPPGKVVSVEVRAIADMVLAAAVDPTYLSFGAATPSSELFPLERVRRAIARSAVRHIEVLGRYALAPGAEVARQAISRRALSLGCDLDHRRIVLTNGCMDAIILCLRAVTKPGDVVAIESPTYFAYLRAMQALGLRAIEIPTTPQAGLSIEALELALDTQPVKAVVSVPTLSNPLGAIMPLHAKERLANLLATRGVPLVEDVICNDLAPDLESRRAVKSFDRGGNVMICGAFGKTLAPGLRIGWVEAGRWADDVADLKKATSGGQNEFVEWALADLLDHGGYEPSVRQLRSAFAQRMAIARDIIGQFFPPGTRVTDPAGGFILWVELPKSVDATELYRRCIAHRLVIVPGPLFTTSNRYRNCFRLNAGVRWTEDHQQGLRTIGAIASDLASAAA